MFFFISVIKLIPIEIWYLLVMTGIFQAFYYMALARAYKHGEMSIAYPVARTLPVVLVAIVVYIISGGTQALSHTSSLGAILILGGCIMLPMQHLRDIRLKNYINLSCFFSVIAALGTTGYSIIDDHSIEVLKLFFHKSENVIVFSLIYIFFETVATFIWLGIYVFKTRYERIELVKTIKENKISSITAGIGITVAYGMILIAMAFSENVSYVVAFRQLGVFIGAVLGIIFLRENVTFPKMLGMAVLFVGLILIAIGS